MSKGRPTLVSRAQLARYAEVSRAAVTNWGRRGPDFPEPADPERELFDLDQVLGWLSSRAVPANARHPHEDAGTTYADRVRANTGTETHGHSSSAARRTDDDAIVIEESVFRTLNALRGTCPPEEAALLVATLVFLRSEEEDAWNLLREKVRRGDINGAVFTSEFDHFLPPFVSDSFQTLEEEVFTTATAGVASINTRSGTQAALTKAFEHSISLLEKFGGKRFSAFTTPKTLVRMIVEMLAKEEPIDSIYDPCCGIGEFLTEVAPERTETPHPKTLRITGNGMNLRSLGIARMNTALRGIEAEFTHGLPWEREREDEKFDLILSNPPFNLLYGDFSHDIFRYGSPPRNANFAWLQHAIGHLTSRGRAAVLMTNSASSSTNPKEAAIRSSMVEDGTVECIVALPDRLFQHTGIPVTLWILKAPTGRCDGILFIDARGLGKMTSRTVRTLRQEDADLIQRAYHAWRHSASPRDTTDPVPNFSRVAPIREIRDRKYSLAPPVYVSGRTSKPDQTEQAAEVDSLIRHLEFLESQIPRVDTKARPLLREAQRWVR